MPRSLSTLAYTPQSCDNTNSNYEHLSNTSTSTSSSTFLHVSNNYSNNTEACTKTNQVPHRTSEEFYLDSNQVSSIPLLSLNKSGPAIDRGSGIGVGKKINVPLRRALGEIDLQKKSVHAVRNAFESLLCTTDSDTQFGTEAEDEVPVLVPETPELCNSYKSFTPSAVKTPPILQHRSISLEQHRHISQFDHEKPSNRSLSIEAIESLRSKEATTRNFQPIKFNQSFLEPLKLNLDLNLENERIQNNNKKMNMKMKSKQYDLREYSESKDKGLIHRNCSSCIESASKKIHTLLWDVSEYIDSPAAGFTSGPLCEIKEKIESVLQGLGGEYVEDNEYALCYSYQLVRSCKNMRFVITVSRLQQSCKKKFGQNLLIEFSKERSTLSNPELAEICNEFFLGLNGIVQRIPSVTNMNSSQLREKQLPLTWNLPPLPPQQKQDQEQARTLDSNFELDSHSDSNYKKNEILSSGRDYLSSFIDLLDPTRCCPRNPTLVGLAEIYAEESSQVVAQAEGITHKDSDNSIGNSQLREGDITKLNSLFWQGDHNLSRCTCTVLKNIACKGWLKACSVVEKQSLVKEVVRLVHVMQNVDFALELQREAMKCFVALQRINIVDYCPLKSKSKSKSPETSTETSTEASTSSKASFTDIMLTRAAKSNDPTVAAYAKEGLKLAAAQAESL